MRASATSAAEVTNISKHGFWMLINGRELFLRFEEFPWFKEATVEAILRLERPTPGHLFWPELDVDLALDSIEHPQRYPLTSKLDRPPGHARQRPRVRFGGKRSRQPPT